MLLAIYNKVNDNSPFGFLISFHQYADRRQATHDSYLLETEHCCILWVWITSYVLYFPRHPLHPVKVLVKRISTKRALPFFVAFSADHFSRLQFASTDFGRIHYLQRLGREDSSLLSEINTRNATINILHSNPQDPGKRFQGNSEICVWDESIYV